MIIRVTCESEGGAQCPQWALVELQGELRADLPALASALRGNDGGNGLEKSLLGTAEGGGAGDCDAGRAWAEGCTPIGVLTCPRQVGRGGKRGAVRLTVGHHQLEGAMAALPKPLVLLRKTAVPLPRGGQREAAAEEAERGARGTRVGAEGMDVEGGRQESGGGEGAVGQGGGGVAGEGEAGVGYRVAGVIRCKLIFKTRPKLVLSAAR
ncbi:unnamed protein product [Closterium sp. Naga37s-1]|nr:unnamed protein product [Closterium sp. Naga37s-1]